MKKATHTRKMSLYHQIFHTELSISFHVPGKDVYDKCFKFLHLPQNENKDGLMKKDQGDNIKRQGLAQSSKNEKKKGKSKKDEHISAEFELKTVLYCLKTNIRSLCNNRKFCLLPGSSVKCGG
jgi:hypothetical protein